MTDGPRILRPTEADPNAPTLWTCTACGHQLLIPGGLVPVAADWHGRGCIGPRLDTLAQRLDALASQAPPTHSAEANP